MIFSRLSLSGELVQLGATWMGEHHLIAIFEQILLTQEVSLYG